MNGHRLIGFLGVWLAGAGCLFFIFSGSAFCGTALPRGFEKASWGMTVDQLRDRIKVQKADPQNGFGYADHMEEDPDVYLRIGPHGERIEYYFFRDELYKIFIVYDRILFHTRFYDELIEEMKDAFGPPGKVFEEKYFGLDIQHNLWEDSASVLDLRKGAGFIYQVRIDKKRDDEKKKAIARRKSI